MSEYTATVTWARDDQPFVDGKYSRAHLISFDGGHLTPDGAKYVGKILITSPLLADL